MNPFFSMIIIFLSFKIFELLIDKKRTNVSEHSIRTQLDDRELKVIQTLDGKWDSRKLGEGQNNEAISFPRLSFQLFK